MLKFIFKRLGYLVITLLIVSFVNFMLIKTIPGDPLGQLASKLPPEVKKSYYEKYGLNKSKFEQFGIFIKKMVLDRDMGESLNYPGKKVSDIIKDNSPVSMKLGLISLTIGVSVGILLGIMAALKRGKGGDYLVMFIAVLGVSIPAFILASLLQYLFTVKWRIFPTIGWGETKHLFLPVFALCLGPIAGYARYMRTNCLEVLNQDYMLTAKAKGLSKFKVVKRHMFRNAITPIITLLAPQIAMIFLGSFIIENVFSIPGLGVYLLDSINNRDYPMLMGLTTLISFMFVVSMVVVDILYGLIDPRIRVGGGRR